MKYDDLIPDIDRALLLLDNPEIETELSGMSIREDLQNLKSIISNKEYDKKFSTHGWDGPPPYDLHLYMKASESGLFSILRHIKQAIHNEYDSRTHNTFRK